MSDRVDQKTRLAYRIQSYLMKTEWIARSRKYHGFGTPIYRESTASGERNSLKSKRKGSDLPDVPEILDRHENTHKNKYWYQRLYVRLYIILLLLLIIIKQTFKTLGFSLVKVGVLFRVFFSVLGTRSSLRLDV